MPEGSNTITLASRDNQGSCNLLQWTPPFGGHDLPLYSVWVFGTWSISFCSCHSLLLLAPFWHQPSYTSNSSLISAWNYLTLLACRRKENHIKRIHVCMAIFYLLPWHVWFFTIPNYFQVLSAHFRAYIQALEKLQMDIATSTDLLGVETFSPLEKNLWKPVLQCLLWVNE
jgi:hypothetical protein